MPEFIYYVAASLDGYIATPEGDVNWLSPFESSDQDYGYSKFYESVEATVMGSRTYEQILSFGEWPYPEKSCCVFSQRHLKTKQPEVTLTNKSPKEVVPELEGRNLRRIWLVGGAKLATAFRKEGLITEYSSSKYAVIIRSSANLQVMFSLFHLTPK